jgi:hypothetical protein
LRLTAELTLLPLKVFENENGNGHVPSVYHGLNGTNREGLKLKGFLRYRTVHRKPALNCLIALKSLAIPAGFEPATHGVEIRYSVRPGRGRINVYRHIPRMRAPISTLGPWLADRAAVLAGAKPLARTVGAAFREGSSPRRIEVTAALRALAVHEEATGWRSTFARVMAT